MLNLEAGSAFAHTPIKYLLVSTCATRTGHSSHGLMEADDVNMRTHNNSFDVKHMIQYLIGPQRPAGATDEWVSPQPLSAREYSHKHSVSVLRV